MVQEQVQRTMRKSPRQTRELAQRLGKLTEAQAALGWAIILVLAALLGAIYLNQTSKVAAAGRRVQLLQEDLSILRDENSAIERSVARAQTLESLQQEAKRLGFTETNQFFIEYLVIPQLPPPMGTMSPLDASLTSELALPATLSQPAESMQEALWLALQGTINNLVRGESSER